MYTLVDEMELTGATDTISGLGIDNIEDLYRVVIELDKPSGIVQMRINGSTGSYNTGSGGGDITTNYIQVQGAALAQQYTGYYDMYLKLYQTGAGFRAAVNIVRAVTRSANGLDLGVHMFYSDCSFTIAEIDSVSILSGALTSGSMKIYKRSLS